MASLPRDDSQGRTSGILGICRKAPGTEDQAKILTLKTDQELQETPQNRRTTPNADCGERPYADQTHQPMRVPAREVRQNALMDQNNPETRSRKVPGSRDLGPKIGQNDARQTRGIVQDADGGSRGGRPVRAVEPRSPRGRTAKPNAELLLVFMTRLEYGTRGRRTRTHPYNSPNRRIPGHAAGPCLWVRHRHTHLCTVRA